MNKLIRLVILALILISGLTVAGCSSAPAPVKPSQEGNLAPDFQLQSLDGQTVSLSSLRGRPVMLNFWATWCGPCRAELPYLQGVSEDREFMEKGLVILAINVGEASSEVKKFMEDNGLSFRILLDTDTRVAEDYNVSGIPMTLFIDKNGIIKDRKIGNFANRAEIEWRLINSILEGE